MIRSCKKAQSPQVWAVLAVSVLILAFASGQAAQAQTFTILHTFVSGSDGAQPIYWPTPDASGNLYGVTSSGGCNPACNYGTVYKVTAGGAESIMHVFPTGSNDGENPSSPLLIDPSGNLYGTTQNGGTPINGCTPPPPGATGCGTVYRLTAAGTETILYNYSPSSTVQFPMGPFVLYGNKLFGAATGPNQQNGDSGDGVIYGLSPAGIDVFHQFTGGDDGANPQSGVIRDKSGNVYGTTYLGGTSGLGTIFKIDTSGNKTVLYNFAGTDGAYPDTPLLMDSAGNFYGATYEGGSFLVGTLFKLDTSNTLTVLYNFVGGTSGAYPSGNLYRDPSGNLYGSTLQGGGSKDGTVYMLSAAGTETVLHAFTGTPDGATPSGVSYFRGALYGTTSAGGDATCQCGTLYKISR